ncbi:MAG: acyltransferase [Chloroflexales bacterium]
MHTPPPHPNRVLGLDLVRFVAVLLVIGRHLQLPPESPYILEIWRQGGWVGVDLFFVLSGFLVSSLLFNEFKRTGTTNVKRFLIRRGFKIYPAFWLLIAFSIVVRLLIHYSFSIESLLGELFFLQNYLGAIWSHTWSLAVEEHFYLGLAILFSSMTASRSATGTQRLRYIPVVFVIVSITCFTLRIITAFIFPEFSLKNYVYGTHLRIDSLFYGVLLSYLWHFRELEKKIAWIPSWFLYLSGWLLLAPAFIFQLETHKWIPVAGVILFFVGSGNILIAALRITETSFTPLKLLGNLSAASYSIYLWHMPINLWGSIILRKITRFDSFPLYFFSYIIGSFAFGWLMNQIIEAPVLFLRDSLFPVEEKNRRSSEHTVD